MAKQVFQIVNVGKAFRIAGTVAVLVFAAVLALGLSSTALGQEKTVVKSNTAKRMLLGRHFFSLQWISWDYYGRVTVTQKDGLFHLKGGQEAREGEDFVSIDGVVTELSRYEFMFKGKIVTKISHINNGEPCVREGEMTFKITGTRKYWRLQEMNNPCENVVDYIDIYFRK